MAWSQHGYRGQLVRAATVEAMRNARWDRLRCVSVLEATVPDTIKPGHYTNAYRGAVLADSTGVDGSVYRGKVADGPLDLVLNANVGSGAATSDGTLGLAQYIDWRTDDGWTIEDYWSIFAPYADSTAYWTSRPASDGIEVLTAGMNAEKSYRCYEKHHSEFMGLIENQRRVRMRSGGHWASYYSEGWYPQEAGWAPTTLLDGGAGCGGVQYEYVRYTDYEQKILRWVDYVFDLRAFSKDKFNGGASDCKLYMYFSPDLIIVDPDPTYNCTPPFGTDICWATELQWSSDLTDSLGAVGNGPIATFDINAVPGQLISFGIDGPVNESLGYFLVLRFINHNWQIDPKQFAPTPPDPGVNVNAYTRGVGFSWSCHINMTLSFPDNTNTWGQLGGSKEHPGGDVSKGMWGQNWGLIPGQYA